MGLHCIDFAHVLCSSWMHVSISTLPPFRRTREVSCTRLRILLNTICRKPGFNSLRTPLNHGAEQATNETLKQTQQRNWSNAFQGGQTALKEHFAVLHYETVSTTQQPRGEHRGTIKDCKVAGATTWQGQGNHTFTTMCHWTECNLFALQVRLSEENTPNATIHSS